MCCVLLFDFLFVEKKKDKEYWGNPQVYIKCGEVAIGPHFILHNFKVKDSFSFNLKPKKLAVLGELRYEVRPYLAILKNVVFYFVCCSVLTIIYCITS